MKVLSRSIKFILLFIVFLLIALVVFIATFDANNYKSTIIEQVEKATSREFTIEGDINLSVFPWIGLKVEDAALGNESGFKEKQFAAIKQLDIKVNVLPLLRKEVEINTIRLHGLNVALEVAKDKTNNWSSLSQPGKEQVDKPSDDTPEASKTAETSAEQIVSDKDSKSPLQALRVEGFELVDAVILYDDRSSGTKATVSALNLITSEIQFDQPVELSFSARVENNQPAIDTRLKLTTQLTFNKELTIFNLNDFIFTIFVNANEFINQDEELVIKSDIYVSMDEERVRLKQLQLLALDTTTVADINVSQFLQTPLIQGNIEVQPFNARAVASRAGVELPEMAKADALQQIALKTKIKMLGEKLEADDFSLMLDGSTLSGWLHVINLSKQQLRYDLAFDQLNVNDYLPPVKDVPESTAESVADTTEKSETPKDVATVTDTSGDEKIELPVEMMRQLDVQGDFRIAAITVKEYNIKEFSMSIKAQKGEINIKPLSLQLLDGKVTAAVNVNVQKNTPDYGINLDVNQVQAGPVVNPFLTNIQADKPISMKGAVNFAMKVKTTGETVNQLKQASLGNIILDMNTTEVNGFDPEFFMRSAIADYVHSKGFGLSKTIMGDYEPRELTVFDKIYSTVNLAKGIAHTDDFLMDSKRVKVGAKGDVDIMQNSTDMMTSIELARSKTALEKILDEPLYIRVHGPFEALEFDIDKARMKKSTTDVLENEAKAKIDAEKQKLKAKANAEKQRLKEKADEEKRQAEEKAKQKLKEEADKAKDKLKDKLKGLF